MGKIDIKVDYIDNYAACPVDDRIACVSTGRTFEELRKNINEGLHFHIEGMREDGEAIPTEFQGEWEYQWHFTIRALLHYSQTFVSKAAISKVTGINQQQLTHYASGYRHPKPMMESRIREGIHTIAEALLHT